jgi:hypothetical protein
MANSQACSEHAGADLKARRADTETEIMDVSRADRWKSSKGCCERSEWSVAAYRRESNKHARAATVELPAKGVSKR